MSDATALLIVVCFTVFAFYALLLLIDLIDARVKKRFRDSIDPDWWWEEIQE